MTMYLQKETKPDPGVFTTARNEPIHFKLKYGLVEEHVL